MQQVLRTLCVVLVVLSVVTAKKIKVDVETPGPKGAGPGIAFSGAGGRLGQHAALMEVLVKGLYPNAKPLRPAYISGVSAGSLSAVALNAIIETEERKIEGGFSWQDYKELLFNLTTSNIYDNSWTGLAKALTVNIARGYILDNSPLEALLYAQLKRMNYTTLGDLYIPTCISLVNQTSGETTRLWSTDPRFASLPLVDVLMASTAIPVAFPPRTVDGLEAEPVWIDGGTGMDAIPVFPLLVTPQVTELYLIAYHSVLTSDGAYVPWFLNHLVVLKNAMAAFDSMRADLNRGAINLAADGGKKSFVYIPNINMTFSMLDFDDEKLQYELTFDWAQQNPPQGLVNNGNGKPLFKVVPRHEDDL